MYDVGDARGGDPYDAVVNDGFERAKGNWVNMMPPYREVCSQYYRCVAALQATMRSVEDLSRTFWEAKDETLDTVYDEQKAVTESARNGHNKDVTNLLSAAKPTTAPSPSGHRVAIALNDDYLTDRHFDFVTPRGTAEHARLADVRSYRESAKRHLAAPGQAFTTERGDYLTLAHYAEYVADSAYANGDVRAGDTVLDGSRRLVDDVFDWSTVKDDISRGSTFIAGVLHGASGGILRSRPLEGYERDFGAGEIVGAAIGILADGTAIAGALCANVTETTHPSIF